MIPQQWGLPQGGPRLFNLVSDGMKLKERYRRLRESNQIDEVFDVALGAGATTVYLDRPYVDLDYRSDLAHYYGRAFQPPPETTERLIFTDERKVIGVSVMRPLPQQVGRTMLPPPAEEARYVSCLCDMPVHAFGYDWEVRGYPFSSQDGEYGVCAHAAMWSIARYHHLKYRTDRFTISGIIEAAGRRDRPDKTSPGDGWYGQDIVRAFRGMGLPPLQYDIEDIPLKKNETPESVIRRYLNSGLPVAVLTFNHMLVLIGYGERANGELFYIVSDDNYSAYQRMDRVPVGQPEAWRMLIVPQPGRMHITGEGAAARAEEAFEDCLRRKVGPVHLLPDFLGRKKGPEHQYPREAERKLRVETYATPSHAYLSGLEERGVPDAIRKDHIYAPQGSWLWVTEIQDADAPDDKRVVGEIAVDATSRFHEPSPLFGNIDGWGYRWDSAKRKPDVNQLVEGGAQYRSALPDRSEQPVPSTPRAYVPFDPKKDLPVDCDADHDEDDDIDERDPNTPVTGEPHTHTPAD